MSSKISPCDQKASKRKQEVSASRHQQVKSRRLQKCSQQVADADDCDSNHVCATSVESQNCGTLTLFIVFFFFFSIQALLRSLLLKLKFSRRLYSVVTENSSQTVHLKCKFLLAHHFAQKG